ncbi:MAG TPA: DUF4386 family protein [Gaiellaceae bacterium]|nr:DUF4386 family protein [Gaiellaceae bacterium]
MSKPAKNICGVAMVLAPLLGIASAIASPALQGSDSAKLAEIASHPDRWYLYALFITASSWLFVPAVLALIDILSERSPRLGLVGGGLALLGVLIAIGDGTCELMYWQMGARGADRPQMAALARRFETATGSSQLFTIGGLALIIGLVLLAVALWRTDAVPALAALGLPAGAALNIAGFSSNNNALVIASNAVLLAALGWIASVYLASASERQATSPHVATT